MLSAGVELEADQSAHVSELEVEVTTAGSLEEADQSAQVSEAEVTTAGVDDAAGAVGLTDTVRTGRVASGVATPKTY